MLRPHFTCSWHNYCYLTAIARTPGNRSPPNRILCQPLHFYANRPRGHALNQSMQRRAFLGLVAGAAAAPFVVRKSGAAAPPPPPPLADPAIVGVWGPRKMLPGIPIHMTALPGTSNVFMASWLKSGAGTQAWVYDSATGIITDCTLKTFPYDFMCGGAILDDAGNLRVYGGRINAERTARFDAAKLRGPEGPKLSVARTTPPPFARADRRAIRVGRSRPPDGAGRRHLARTTTASRS